MIKNGLFSFLLLFCVLTQAACGEEKQIQSLPATSLQIKTVDGDIHNFQIEIATTTEQQSIGLMNRKSMPEDSGMLFVFSSPRKTRFWMKNTLIPLDMLFIAENGVIYHIHENAKPHDLSGISSEGLSKAVLELNGGMAEQYGIKEGSQLIINSWPE